MRRCDLGHIAGSFFMEARLMSLPVTKPVVRSARDPSFCLARGPATATPLIFVHGWPELSVSWWHRLPVFTALGFRCVAPTMRGHGRSNVPTGREAYALEHNVRDMIERLHLLAATRPSGSAMTGAARWAGSWPATILTAASAAPVSACPICRTVSRRSLW
jgi:pimeloyl-ACP methyl ester carboxylesterase